MRKTLSFLLVFTLAFSTLTGCGGSSDTSSSKQSSEAEATEEADVTSETEGPRYPEGTYVMRIGHAQTETSPRHRSLECFKKKVEKETDQKVVVEIYPNGEKGNETEMTEAVSSGDLEAVRGGDLEYVPKTTMLGLPMIADNLEQARKLCYSDFVKQLLSTAETDHNMKVLAVGDDSGFRQITNNVRPIKKPSDMKGLKMRAPLDVVDLSLQAFGASTVSIPFTELYDALESGTVDGQENPLALIDSNQFYAVQKYCTIIDYMFFAELMYVNLDWWETLPEDLQEIVTRCAQEMMAECAKITDEENEKYIEDIEKNGCKIYKLSAKERKAFQPLAESVWKQYVDNERISKEELDKMLAVIGKKVDW